MWNKWWISQLILSFTIRNYLFLCHSLLHSVLQQPSPCRLEQISVLCCYCSTRFSCLSQCCSKKWSIYMESLVHSVLILALQAAGWCTALEKLTFEQTPLGIGSGSYSIWELSGLRSSQSSVLSLQEVLVVPSSLQPALPSVPLRTSGVQSSLGNRLGNIIAVLLFYCKRFQQTVQAEWNGWN